MTTPESVAPVGWSRKKWIYLIIAVFAFQVGAILSLGQREAPAITSFAFGTRLHLAADPWSFQQIAENQTLSDPSAFALPSAHGFSREGWLSFTRPEFRLTDWTEPPQWLGLDTESLGASLHQFILSNTTPALLIADKPLPRLAREEGPVGNAPAPTRSEFSIEGPLAQWSLLQAVELPSWTHTDLLTNTVVHLLVDRDGRAFANATLASSGSAEADQFALRLARSTRFRPPQSSRAPQSASGKLIFRWHTLPGTNTSLIPPASGP